MAKSRERWKKKQGEKPLQSENYKKIERKFKKLHRKVSRQRQARILDIKSYFIKIMLENNLNQVALEDLDVKKITNKENVIGYIGTKRSKKMRKNLLSVGYGKIREEIEDAVALADRGKRSIALRGPLACPCPLAKRIDWPLKRIIEFRVLPDRPAPEGHASAARDPRAAGLLRGWRRRPSRSPLATQVNRH